MRKRLITFMTAVCMLLTLLPVQLTAFADGAATYTEGNFTITTDVAGGYTYSNNVLAIIMEGEYEISGTTTEDRIVVSATEAVTIKLSGLSITSSNASPFNITGSGDVTIKLSDTNTLTTTASAYAGLQKSQRNNTLTITSASGDGSSEGSLTVTGGGSSSDSDTASGAGIGGGSDEAGSSIIINGGTITATGGDNAAGIGGGYNGAGSNITINGGTVIASSNRGAGIGGGYNGGGSNITVNDGTITASSTSHGAGIGGGTQCAGTDITINGGTITATGGTYGAGIGGGNGSSGTSDGSNITITGGTVSATGGSGGESGLGAAGIGGGYKGCGSNIAISGGYISATAGSTASVIGSGVGGDAASGISITGGCFADTDATIGTAGTGKVYGISIGTGYQVIANTDGATNGTYKYAVTDYQLYCGDLVVKEASDQLDGCSYDATNELITISKAGEYTISMALGMATTTVDRILVKTQSAVTLILNGISIDMSASSGVSPIDLSSAGACTVKLADGTENTLIAGSGASGIYVPNGNLVTFAGNGSLNVTGGKDSAGIGRNSDGNGNILIAGGTITATGGANAAGIGGSSGYASGTVEIQGGTVTATGGTSGAGIGGGSGGVGSNITISDGDIMAIGGTSGAGIGGGDGAVGSNITISGGNIEVHGGGDDEQYGGDDGAGIGGGKGADGNKIAINDGTITAYAGYDGAGIGGGTGGSGTNITITGGNIETVNYSDDARMIGGGNGGDASDITISGGYISGDDGDTIGAGEGGTETNISVTGGCYADNTYAVSGVGGGSSEANVYGVKVGEGYVVYENNDPYSGNLYGYFVSTTGGLEVTTDGVGDFGYGYGGSGSERAYYISRSGEYTVTMASGFATSAHDRIEIAADAKVEITLKDVSISNESASPFSITGSGNVTLKLSGTNTLTTTADNCAGLQKTATANTLTIASAASDGSTDGTLNVTGGTDAAGISGSNIVIDGGTIVATGGSGGAGIGGSDITINTGAVTAAGGSGGAGIGSSGITINDGMVTAAGGDNGAGIGGGNATDGSDITINGGTIKLTGGSNAAALGGGCNGSASGVTIDGGYITLVKDTNGTYIGSGSGGAVATDILISGGYFADTAATTGTSGKIYDFAITEGYEVIANTDESTSGTYGYTVEEVTEETTYGYLSVVGQKDRYTYDETTKVITIAKGGEFTVSMAEGFESTNTERIKVTSDDDVTLTLNGVNIESSAASPLTITGGGDVTIELSGDNVLTSKSMYYPGLQKTTTANMLTITSASGDGSTDGSLTATGCSYYDSDNSIYYGSAGIGGGNGETGSYIAITGGTITATGGDYAAGIGGGSGSGGSNITIGGGMVNATGGVYAAGIGGGKGGSGSYITITDGEIRAIGGNYAAGIGGGSNGSLSNLSISGGYILANAGENSSYRIGAGNDGNALTSISITGGSFGAGNASAETVYEIGVASGYTVYKNEDSSAYENYPYVVAEKNHFEVSGTDESYSYSYTTRTLTITGFGEYEITMRENVTSTSTDRIVVESEIGANITLKDVRITSSTASPLEINSEGDVTIYLSGTNVLKSTAADYAGIQKTSTENTLTITDGEAYATLSVTGGANAAAIGGGNGGDANNITIAGGYISLGTSGSSVIGPGNGGTASNISITGGCFNANSSTAVTGTGGSIFGISVGDGYCVYENSDTVYNDVYKYFVSTVSDFNVESDLASSIVYAYTGSGCGKQLIISSSGDYALSMRDGVDTTSTDIISVKSASTTTITLTNLSIESSILSPFYITGGGDVDIKLSGTNTLISNISGYAGLQKNLTTNTLTISDLDASNPGTLIATGGSYAAGIGSGNGGTCSGITITGGYITATGGLHAAGIGGGYEGGCSNITITGGYINAVAGTGASGIGCGYDCGDSARNMSITGGYFYYGDTSAGTVCGVSVGEGYKVVEDDEQENYKYTITYDKYDAECGGLVVNGKKGSFSYNSSTGVVTLSEDGDFTISMYNGAKSTNTERIVVTSDEDTTITLNSINVTSSTAAPIDITGGGNVTIKLEGDNTLTTTASGYAGLQKTSSDNTLTITSAAEDGSTDGTLTATGGDYAAGIGGGNGVAGSNIAISGGTVTATGGYYGAGIGGGYNGAGSSITIDGGTVTATGGYYGAGIGGGNSGAGSNITISGGTVTATGGDYGAGIGGGYYGAGSNITISGGYITATGGEKIFESGYAPGIGSGCYGATATDILITGGHFATGDTSENTVYDISVASGYTVYANSDSKTSSSYPYFVSAGSKLKVTTSQSCGYSQSGSDLVTILSSGGEYTIAMADGYDTTSTDVISVTATDAVTITLSGVSIESGSAAPIEINSKGNVTIKLSGTNVLTTTADNCAGLQKTSTSNTLTITNADSSNPGSLTAAGGAAGAGIGGGYQGDGSNITISGGTITATGGYTSAGIGGGGPNGLSISGYGYGGAGTNITITGGTVTATGNFGAGIGGSRQGNSKNIAISGGTVTATGGYGTPAIGAGANGGTSSGITISGGYIKATAGSHADCIIGANDSSDTSISISGGFFTAGNTTADTIYGITVADGCYVVENDESDTKDEYPYVVSSSVGLIVTTDYTDGYSRAEEDGGRIVLTISSGGDYRISMAGGVTTTTDSISVTAEDDVTITLSDVTIETDAVSPIEINSTGNVTIILSGTNILTTTAEKYAGLQKISTGNTLTITSISGDGSTNGSLTAIGGKYGAGIGGGYGKNVNNITIDGGTITAIGGDSSAGIGGGYQSHADYITISGGIVTAAGGSNGAGIGGGIESHGNNITISGGTVTATGGENAAGIGNGYDNSIAASNIIIYNASVKASSVSITPTAADGSTSVYLYEIPNTTEGDSIIIDGTTVIGSIVHHTDSDAFQYLYLPESSGYAYTGDTLYALSYSEGSTAVSSGFTASAESSTLTEVPTGIVLVVDSSKSEGDTSDVENYLNKPLITAIMANAVSAAKITSYTVTISGDNLSEPQSFTPTLDGLFDGDKYYMAQIVGEGIESGTYNIEVVIIYTLTLDGAEKVCGEAFVDDVTIEST